MLPTGITPSDKFIPRIKFYGDNPLLLAARVGAKNDVVDFLLDKKVDVHALEKQNKYVNRAYSQVFFGVDQVSQGGTSIICAANSTGQKPSRTC